MAFATTFPVKEAILTLVVTDNSEQTRQTRIGLLVDTTNGSEVELLNDAQVLAAAYAAATRGALERYSVSIVAHEDDAPLPLDATNGSLEVDDVAILEFQTALGRKVRMQIAAPLSGTTTVFAGDKETVDETDALIAAVIAAVLNAAARAASDAILEYVRGWRDGRNRRGVKLGVYPGHTA